MDTAPKTYKNSPSSIESVAALLKSGRIVALPTETVYGLAADALNPEAVARIFEIKGRPLIDPLIIHISDPSQAENLVIPNKSFELLAEAFWPGPLTLVANKRACVPDIVTAGLDSAAIRCPAHPVMQSVLKKAGIPLAAPSANPFSYISPTTAKHVTDSLGHRLDYVLDGGPCTHGLESTIVDVRDIARPRLLRPGPISSEEISEALSSEIFSAEKSKGNESQTAPGSLPHHYSPSTPLVIAGNNHEQSDNTATIHLFRPTDPTGTNNYWCTETDRLEDAAAALYALLRKVDGMNYKQIAIHKAAPKGIGVALNDRIDRACAKK